MVVGGPFITISVVEYTQLLDAQNKLSALKSGGVDNWEWYSESLADYYAEKEKDEATG